MSTTSLKTARLILARPEKEEASWQKPRWEEEERKKRHEKKREGLPRTKKRTHPSPKDVGSEERKGGRPAAESSS